MGLIKHFLGHVKFNRNIGSIRKILWAAWDVNFIFPLKLSPQSGSFSRAKCERRQFRNKMLAFTKVLNFQNFSHSKKITLGSFLLLVLDFNDINLIQMATNGALGGKIWRHAAEKTETDDSNSTTDRVLTFRVFLKFTSLNYTDTKIYKHT